MPKVVTIEEARAILGADVLGTDEVSAAFGTAVSDLPSAIPFSRDDLEAAKRAGEMLVLRSAQDAAKEPLTILRMLQHTPQAFDPKFLRKVGYQLKDEWGIELEPYAATAACTSGWGLVRKAILDASRNLAYEEQTTALEGYAKQLGVPPATLRRRSGVEMVYDTLLYFLARGQRLLAKEWDWSATRTVDGGFLNAGGFGANGMQIFSYSRAVRHGALGICPTRDRGR